MRPSGSRLAALVFLAFCVTGSTGQSETVYCSCCGSKPSQHRNGRTSKAVTKVIILPRQPCFVWEDTPQALAIPFRLAGNGIYAVVQGPRMLAEWIAFGHIGENFATPDVKSPRKWWGLWKPPAGYEDALWVPPLTYNENGSQKPPMNHNLKPPVNSRNHPASSFR